MASAQIAVDDTELRKILGVSDGLPYPIPALKITRLCISDQFKRQKIGSLLVAFAEIVAYEQQNKIGCRALLVDAKEKAIGFYESLGFSVLGDMEDGICLMFKDIPSLRSKDIDHKPEQKEMVREFIDFCGAFDLAHFLKTFEKILLDE